jgi:hypothetical protein
MGWPARDAAIVPGWTSPRPCMFLNLMNMMMGSDQRIIDEVEAGEDHIKAQFEKAMREENLSAPVKGAVSKVSAVPWGSRAGGLPRMFWPMSQMTPPSRVRRNLSSRRARSNWRARSPSGDRLGVYSSPSAMPLTS